jgi:hypothetical protein
MVQQPMHRGAPNLPHNAKPLLWKYPVQHVLVYHPLLSSHGGNLCAQHVSIHKLQYILYCHGRTWSGWNRGAVVVSGQGPTREGLYLGVGRAAAGRRGMFRAQEGLVVEMQQRVFELPSLSGEASKANCTMSQTVNAWSCPSTWEHT